MANNIYVGGFPYKTTKEDLAKLFSACGTVLSAKVILDRDTGRPKGFGFVEMSTDAEAKVAVEKLNGAFIGDRKIFVVEGRVDKTRPQGYTPKPSFAPKPAGDSPKANRPGFVERRSGKDRRGQPAASDRRDSAPPPAAPSAPFAKKPWEKKPFDAAKKPWVKKPFDAAKKPWEKKPFDAAKKPWEKKPFDAAKKPWEKKPFDAAKKPFERKPPTRGPKWTPNKD
jgi:RNA recognition motif-containing protein